VQKLNLTPRQPLIVPLDKIVVDTSIIINGRLTELVQSGAFAGCEILFPEAAVDELQSMAAQKKDEGFVGLKEIQKIKDIAAESSLSIKFVGERPNSDDISLAERGRIDAIIKDTAMQNDATLYTSDKLQSMVAEIEGISVSLQSATIKEKPMEFLRFFDSGTMSIHLKEGQPPMAKRGKPGHFELVQINGARLTKEYLEDVSAQILEAPKHDANTYSSKPGALVIQYQDYRIVITHKPFSERYEITIVHPIIQMSLKDYEISPKLMERFSQKAEGILISGPPGSGKSTLASGLANFYHDMGKIVKTFESPRDLQVNSAITQYTKLDESFEDAADILLLVRPDYTIFDEVRRREDFGIFSDMRLTGVGMVGVVHANAPMDSIQRFIGKIELGIIPSVLDTVIFVKEGRIDKVYQLELKVKVPSGMTEQDLARPVIEISDFESGRLEYEIYTFGEENIVMPVSGGEPMHKLVQAKIRDIFTRYDPNAEIEILSAKSVRIRVAEQCIPEIIGRGGSRINELERELQVRIDVQERRDGHAHNKFGGAPAKISRSNHMMYIQAGKSNAGKDADIMVKGKLLASALVSKNGQIKLNTHSKVGRLLDSANPDDIDVVVRDF